MHHASTSAPPSLLASTRGRCQIGIVTQDRIALPVQGVKSPTCFVEGQVTAIDSPSNSIHLRSPGMHTDIHQLPRSAEQGSIAWQHFDPPQSAVSLQQAFAVGFADSDVAEAATMRPSSTIPESRYAIGGSPLLSSTPQEMRQRALKLERCGAFLETLGVGQGSALAMRPAARASDAA